MTLRAGSLFQGFYHFLRRKKNDNDLSLRDTIEELIEESDTEPEPSLDSDERMLLGNVLNLRDLTAQDVMIPRADIIAVPVTISASELIAVFSRSYLSRLPVYRDNLDNTLGLVHVKDLVGPFNSQKPFKLRPLIREVLFIAPTMRTLDLLFQMRQTGAKMAMVVDEYGGVDGLVTFSDLIEEIIGDIQDAHDIHVGLQIDHRPDGSICTDARLSLEELQENLKIDLRLPELSNEIDTIGGLVASIAGRVPTRGELIKHPKGYEIEVMDADPRRVKRICLRTVAPFIDNPKS